MNYENRIEAHDRLFDLKFREVWAYRDLLYLFVWRDFVSKYKQTILGPAWFLVQPLVEVVTYSIIFGQLANLPTDGSPKGLFYLAGITCWNYFSLCLTTTSSTFTSNSGLFGKVYFPRMVTPFSIIASNSIQFILQFTLFVVMYLVYVAKGAEVAPNGFAFGVPFIIVLTGLMGLGLGMIISSLTTKYRDLQKVVSFGVGLLMYATPVVYPLSILQEKAGFAQLILLNPLVGIIESFKYATLGIGEMQWGLLLYSFLFTIGVFYVGVVVFNRTEKNFMDTV